MRAVVLHEHGDNDKLQLVADYPTPKAGAGDVVIRVKASSINYHDVFTRRGMPGIKVPLPVIIGLDVVGEIAEIGAGVEGWKIGDRVLIDPVNRVEGGLMGETQDGGLAEYCRAKAHQLVAIPDQVSFEQAAALPVAYGTAIRMMNTVGQIKSGEKVLILGASGGVGVCCVQLAKLAGAHVIACAGTPACTSAKLPTRQLAPEVASAARALVGSPNVVHLSGCSKGCAHPGPAAITIVGPDSVVVNGRASDTPRATVSSAGLIADIEQLCSQLHHD